MWLKLVGLFHLAHAPCLTIVPFYVNNRLADIIYINYFFMIMFSYTFINGECPISYLSKRVLDPTYFSGKDLDYYPEMRMFFRTDQDILRYFTITNVTYLFSLGYVIHRSKMYIYNFIVPFLSLSYYFLFVRVYNVEKETIEFAICQELTKYITLLMNIFIMCQYDKINI